MTFVRLHAHHCTLALCDTRCEAFAMWRRGWVHHPNTLARARWVFIKRKRQGGDR